MRWQDREGSENVEDRRGSPGMGGGRMIGGSLVGVVVVVALALITRDPRVLMLLLQQGPAVQQNGEPDGPPREFSPEEQQEARFASVVLRDTEDVWSEIFQKQAGRQYEKPTLVLYTQGTRSGCGLADSAVGPFYCPADGKVYLDLSFFDDMRTQFQSAGEFPRAYVIAHEVGHHVQNLLGISDKVHNLQEQAASKAEANEYSVRLELQADYFAGVWAKHADERWKIVEEGDIEAAIRCAQAIGDDRLQKQARGYVVPDSFTHGTSEQRARWFTRGWQSGDIRAHDPFKEERL